MRLIDFVVQVLFVQSNTLRALASCLSENRLLSCLENVEFPNSDFTLDPLWFETNEPNQSPEKSSFEELEGAVSDFRLSPELETYLWSYPFYRALIENSIDLKAKFKKSNQIQAKHLIDQAFAHARVWIDTLPLPAEIENQATHAALIPWIKFQAEELKRQGNRNITLA